MAWFTPTVDSIVSDFARIQGRLAKHADVKRQEHQQHSDNAAMSLQQAYAAKAEADRALSVHSKISELLK